MGNFTQRNLSTGNAKLYYQNDNDLIATGTLFTDKNMYYIAAHPSLGLWVCGSTMDNSPAIIGFIPWDNIKRVVIDETNDAVFIVVNNYQSILDNADYAFRKVYKKAYTHQMTDNGDMAICISRDLCSGDILPYLQSRLPVEFKKEEVKGSTGMTILYIAILALVIIGTIASLF